MPFRLLSSRRARLVGAGFLAAGVVASVTTVADAVGGLPAGCTWKVGALPMPTGYGSASTSRSDGVTRVAGYGRDAAGRTTPLLWTNGVVSVPASPGGAEAVAQDVTTAGVVLANTQTSSPAPFLVKSGKVTRLGTPAGAAYTVATSINDSGLIAGYASIGDRVHGLVWSSATPGTFRDLGTRSGALFLNDVTETGAILGHTQGATGNETALRGPASGLKALPGLAAGHLTQAERADGTYTLGTDRAPGAGTGSTALWKGTTTAPRLLPATLRGQAVNSTGLVAGYDTGGVRAAAWAAGTLWSLPVLSAASPYGTSVSDVLDGGSVVGATPNAAGAVVPVRWTCS